MLWRTFFSEDRHDSDQFLYTLQKSESGHNIIILLSLVEHEQPTIYTTTAISTTMDTIEHPPNEIPRDPLLQRNQSVHLQLERAFIDT